MLSPPPPTEVLSGQAGQGSQRPPSPPWLATISLVATEPLEVIHLKPLKAPASGLSASGSCVDNPVGWVDVNGVDCPGYAQYLCLVQAFSSPLKPVSSQLVNLSIFPRLPQCSRGGGQLGQHQPFFPHRTRFRKSGSSLQSYQLWQMAIGHTLRQNFAPVNGLLSAAFPNRVMISRRMPSVGKPPYRLVAPAAVGQVCAKSPLSVLFCILSLSLPHWARGSCIFTTISFLYGGVGNAVVFAKKFW